MAIAIIPARGGSRRIPGKNKKMFHGKPIIAYSIMTAQDSGLFERVVVSTDDEDIAEISEQYGADVLIRDPGLCADDVGTQEVAKDALLECGVADGYACVIYPCAPMIDMDKFNVGLEVVKSGGNPYAYSVDGNLFDAGQWYWGYVGAWLCDVELGNSFKIIVSNAVDINTPADWARAEAMFLKESAA